MLELSSFFKASTENKCYEPSGLNPGSPTPEPVFGHPRAALNSSSLTLPTSLLFPLSYFHWISPACSSSSWAVSSHLLATREESVRANPPLSFSNYCPCIQTFSCKAILIQNLLYKYQHNFKTIVSIMRYLILQITLMTD